MVVPKTPIAKGTRRNKVASNTSVVKGANREFMEDKNTMKDYTSQNLLLEKETFFGVKQILENQKVADRPIIFIIKNIKSFNHNVLNELIHLLKKYRSPQANSGVADGCNLCLLLGV